MEVAQILKPEAMRLLPDAGSKKRLFQKLAQAAGSAYGIDSDVALAALLERESLGSTAVGKGVALPHARLPELEHVSCVFTRLDKPMDFGAADRQPVDLVFSIFAPEASGVAHLKALALVSRTMRDKGICAKLRANDDVSTLYTVLTHNMANEAA